MGDESFIVQLVTDAVYEFEPNGDWQEVAGEDGALFADLEEFEVASVQAE